MFGLLHEHQNPLFWGLGAGSSPVFKIICENLADYQPLTQSEDDCTIEEMCLSYADAANAKFSAAEFLPILSGTQLPHFLSADASDVDWDSIMLYSSLVGGKGSGSNRAHVLLKANDEMIPANLEPSEQDVAGLIELYS